MGSLIPSFLQQNFATEGLVIVKSLADRQEDEVAFSDGCTKRESDFKRTQRH